MGSVGAVVLAPPLPAPVKAVVLPPSLAEIDYLISEQWEIIKREMYTNVMKGVQNG